MSGRLFCNLVWAWLLERFPGEKAREQLTSDMYEPLDGAGSRSLMSAIMRAGNDDDEG